MKKLIKEIIRKSDMAPEAFIKKDSETDEEYEKRIDKLLDEEGCNYNEDNFSLSEYYKKLGKKF